MADLTKLVSKHREEIQQIVEKYNAKNVRVFGSVASNTDVEGSDIDLLVETTPETTLFDIGAIKFELSEVLGVEVDVLTPNSLPLSFKKQVERAACST